MCHMFISSICYTVIIIGIRKFSQIHIYYKFRVNKYNNNNNNNLF